MIFVTLGTTKYKFHRALKLIDQALCQANLKENVLIQGKKDDYQFQYPYIQFVTDLKYNKVIFYLKKARIIICHGGATSIYLSLKYGRHLPIIIPRYGTLGEHINNHQLHYSLHLADIYKIPLIQKNNSSDDVAHMITHPILNTVCHKIKVSSKLVDNLNRFTNHLNPQKKIFIVFSSLQFGGVEIKIVDTINFLYHFYPDTKVFLILSKSQTSKELLAKINVPVKIITPPYICNSLPKFFYFPALLTLSIFKYRPTKIIAFMDGNAIVAHIAKKLSFSTALVIASEDTNTLHHLNTRHFSSLRLWLYRFFYPKFTKILTITDKNKQDMVKIGIPASKIAITPQWLSFASIPQVKTTSLIKKFDLLFVGRFDQQKDPLRFINICKSFPTLKILMIGQGPLEKDVRHQINKFGLTNITIRHPDSNILHYYRHSRLLISTSRYEGFPLVIAESLSQSCLPVVPDIPEISWYFDKYTTSVVYNSDTQLITQINRLLSHPKLLSEIINYYKTRVYQDRLPNLRRYLKLITSP